MYTTKNELDFLRDLGTGKYSDVKRKKNRTRDHILKGYLIGCENRKKWENIDREIILKTIKGMCNE